MPNIERMPANPSAVMRHLQAFIPGFNPGVLEIIARRFEWEGFYQQGEEIIRQGGPGDAMYIIDRGSVDVMQHPLGLLTLEPRLVASLRESEIFGERALITNQPRNASVLAASNYVALFRLPVDNWRMLSASYPVLEIAVQKIVEDRLSGASTQR